MNDDNSAPMGEPPRITIHNIKSPFFRTVHADGLFGGVTPHGYIQMSFWNERAPIPQIIEHEIESNGTLGKEIEASRIGKTGLVREVDVDVIMNLETAIAVKKWLDEKITVLMTAVEEMKGLKIKA